jgi:hypothetical protein
MSPFWPRSAPCMTAIPFRRLGAASWLGPNPRAQHRVRSRAASTARWVAREWGHPGGALFQTTGSCRRTAPVIPPGGMGRAPRRRSGWQPPRGQTPRGSRSSGTSGKGPCRTRRFRAMCDRPCGGRQFVDRWGLGGPRGGTRPPDPSRTFTPRQRNSHANPLSSLGTTHDNVSLGSTLAAYERTDPHQTHDL